MKKIALVLLLMAGLAYCEEKAEDLIKKGLDNANNGKYDEAIENLKKAIDLDPKKTEAHFNLGVVYANKKDYDNALKEMEETLKINSGNVNAHYIMAMIYEKKKDKEKALAEWGKVTSSGPEKTMKEVADKHSKRLKEEIDKEKTKK